MDERDIPVPSEIAGGEIIRTLVGSTLHGTGLAGHEDTDLMGVCIEPWKSVLGMERFEQWVWRSAPEGVRSGPQDIDITVYGLKKYLRLACKGNPSILLLLFVPREFQRVRTDMGDQLQSLAPYIISKQVLDPYFGYLQAQKQRLTGERGGKHINRPELVERFGFDTKYAMHALRLAYQGQELLRAGKITLPIPDEPGDILRAVRAGEVPYNDVLDLLDHGQEGLLKAADESTLPNGPDMQRVNEFVRDITLDHYRLTEQWWTYEDEYNDY